MNKKFYIVIGALFLMLNLAVISSQAAPGELDTTFGVNGKVTTPIGTNTKLNEFMRIMWKWTIML